MAEVSKHLKYFVRRKIKEDPVWRRMQVIFSGQEVSNIPAYADIPCSCILSVLFAGAWRG